MKDTMTIKYTIHFTEDSDAIEPFTKEGEYSSFDALANEISDSLLFFALFSLEFGDVLLCPHRIEIEFPW